MNKTEEIVRKFMQETKPFTYKYKTDGRLMTDLCNFFDWLEQKEQLKLYSVMQAEPEKVCGHKRRTRHFSDVFGVYETCLECGREL